MRHFVAVSYGLAVLLAFAAFACSGDDSTPTDGGGPGPTNNTNNNAAGNNNAAANNNTPPPPLVGKLAVTKGAKNPVAPGVKPGDTDFPLMQFTLTNSGTGDTRVTRLRVVVAAMSKPAATFASFQIIDDVNGDGAVSGGDAAVSINPALPAATILTFSNMTTVIPAGASRHWLLVCTMDSLDDAGLFLVTANSTSFAAVDVTSGNGIAPTVTPNPMPSGIAGTGQPTFTWISANIFERSPDPLAQRCANGGCHGGGTQQAGLNLDSAFSDVLNADLLQMATQSTLQRVKPGDPTNSYLVKKLEGTGTGARMPFGGAILLAQEMKALRDWITAGANP